MKLLIRLLQAVLCLALAALMAASFWVMGRITGRSSRPGQPEWEFVMPDDSEMAPLFREGDLLLTRGQAAYEPGDTVAFVPGGEGLQRVRTLAGTVGEQFITANAAGVQEDDLLDPRYIVGRVEIVIPWGWTAVSFLTSLPGVVLWAVLEGLILLLPWLLAPRPARANPRHGR